MKTVLLAFWKDESGFIASSELVLIATIVSLGLVVGLSEVAGAINHELADLASAFSSLNQSFAVSATSPTSAPSQFVDTGATNNAVSIAGSDPVRESP